MIAQKQESNIIEKVEAFIQRMNDFDIAVDSKKMSMPVEHSRPFGLPGECIGTLADLLGESISDYENNRGNIGYAKRALLWIRKAQAIGGIKSGQGLIKKYAECSEENVKLKQELETTSYSLMRAKDRIEELEQIIPNAGSEHA